MEAKPPLRFRTLRIAWSVAWGVVAVLLLALWMRSYWTWDLWDNGVRPPNGGFSSIRGSFGGHIATNPTQRSPLSDLRYYSTPVQPNQQTSWWWIHYKRSPKLTEFIVQYWMLVLFVSIVAASPWIPLRFSLRTLLIVMTLIAAGLGTLALSN